MSIKIALAGNPNSGKTTLFNALTGSNQFVGNWSGVTVEKKEGRLKGEKDTVIEDLPGIYSLSPYSPEEVVARNYLINEKPDAILNIVDGSNLERNLYLTTQLTELGIPVVIAVNMMDVVEKNGDKIDFARLAEATGCDVVHISALKGTGVKEAAAKALSAAKSGKKFKPVHEFSPEAERYIAQIEAKLPASVKEEQKRFFAVKLFERDDKIASLLDNAPDVGYITDKAEKEFDDDAESIITAERYGYIASIIKDCLKKGARREKLSVSDKIDKIVTNRVLALPIFALVMFIVYYISVTTVGTWATDWANDGVFGDGWHLFGIGTAAYQEALEKYGDAVGEYADAALEIEEPAPEDYGIWVPGIPSLIGKGLDALGTDELLNSLILDGIVAGVGAVLGFVPQMLVLFLFLAFLEACGYMARIAFIMDRIFRRFGLSGKSFIPYLIGTGCGVPGIMASRTIENERDRRMTIMTTTFMPCGAKLPIIALFAGAIFKGASWVAPSAYFVGVAAVIVSGIILKKTRMFSGDPAPFVMELPAYHMPTVGNVLRSMWERGWSFIKKAGTIILLATILIWFLQGFGVENGSFGMVEDMDNSILSFIGSTIAWIFSPLGWGDWKAAVAAVTGLIAKENVVGTFGILFHFGGEVAEDGAEIWGNIGGSFTALSGYSYLVFNLLCAPCFAAIGAIRREMNSAKWTWFAVLYQCVFAYLVSLCIYQLGMLFTKGIFGMGTAAAIAVVIIFIYLLVRPYPESGDIKVRQKALK